MKNLIRKLIIKFTLQTPGILENVKGNFDLDESSCETKISLNNKIDLKKSNISLVAIETHDPNGNKLHDFDNISKYFENNLYFVHKKIGPTTLYIKK